MRRRGTRGARPAPVGRPEGRLRALVLLWCPDRNPLRRRADRLQAVLMVVLIATFLCGAPLAALTVGRMADAQGVRIEQAQAGWHRATAVLLRNTPPQSQAVGQASIDPLVTARWRAPDGAQRTGRVYAPGGARAGSTVTVWTDGSGRLTAAPVQHGQVIDAVIIAASLATVAVAVVITGIGLFARWLLDRRRLAAWDERWAVTGPQWTGRR